MKKEDQRTEKQMLSNIEDYTRATMKNTERTARNAAFVTWFIIISIGLSLFAGVVLRM